MKNSHPSRRGHPTLGTLPKGHLQHPRSICHQGQFQSLPPEESLEQNLVTEALAKNQHLPLVGGAWKHSHLGQSHQKGVYRACPYALCVWKRWKQ
jgi:hypothetical protein